MKKVTSILGEVTHDIINEPLIIPTRTVMLCYTINLSPKYYISGSTWGDKTPLEQYNILKRVHRTIYLKMYKFLDEEALSNTVCFEFTKAGELHSHGFFRLEDKYGGYDRYKFMLLKYARAAMLLPGKQKFAVDVRWADNEDKWLEYITKDVDHSGFKPYVSNIESETNILSIVDFLRESIK